MAYRSDVGLAITASALTQLIENFPEFTNDIKKCFDYSDYHIKSNDGNHLFLWNCISWDSINEQASLEDCLFCIDSDDYRFIRSGENQSDIECLGQWYYNDFDFGLCRALYHSDKNIEHYILTAKI